QGAPLMTSRSRIAAALVDSEALTFAEAGRRVTPTLTREAVRQAWLRMHAPPLPAPRPAADPRPLAIRYRLADGRSTSVRVTAEEREAIAAAARAAGVSVSLWLRQLHEFAPPPRGGMLELALAAASED